MKIAYIAGPYTANNDMEIEVNVSIACQVAWQLWQMGFSVICPHANSGFFAHIPNHKHLNTSEVDFIQGDLEIISRFHGGKDCLVMLPRWEESKGARAEREFARNRGLNVFYWPEDKDKLARFVV